MVCLSGHKDAFLIGLHEFSLYPLLHLLRAKGDTLLYTRNYILVFIIGAPFVIANLSLEETGRAEGASTASMIGLISGVVINIILDPIL